MARNREIDASETAEAPGWQGAEEGEYREYLVRRERCSRRMSGSLIRGVLDAPRKRPRHAMREALGEAHFGWVSEAAGRNASES